jgi:hypothetical protein
VPRHDAIHTSDIGLASADNEVMLERARREIVPSLRWTPISTHSLRLLLPESPFRIRHEGLHGEDVARIVAHVVAAGAAEPHAGVVITYATGAFGGASCLSEEYSSVSTL